MSAVDTVLRTALALYARGSDPLTHSRVMTRLHVRAAFTAEERQQWMAELQPWAERMQCWETLRASIERNTR